MSLVAELAARIEKRADKDTVLRPLMRVDDVPTRIPTPFGFHLCGPPNSAAMMAMMRIAGTHPYEPLISLIALHMTQCGGTFIDVGANIGYFSLLTARGTTAPLQVHALEPLPRNFRWVRENIDANGLTGSVAAYAVAAGAEEGELPISDYGTGASFVAGWDEGRANEQPAIPVPVRRLDDLFEIAHLPGPVTIKIDVEGYEWEAVSGAPKLLASPSVHCVLLELNHGMHPGGHNKTAGDTLAAMQSHGFSCFGHYSPEDRRIQVADTDLYRPADPRIQTTETGPDNWVCVRETPTWEALVRRLPFLYGVFCITSHRPVLEIKEFLAALTRE
jgi:FkbM family methyltransferase